MIKESGVSGKKPAITNRLFIDLGPLPVPFECLIARKITNDLPFLARGAAIIGSGPMATVIEADDTQAGVEASPSGAARFFDGPLIN